MPRKPLILSSVAAGVDPDVFFVQDPVMLSRPVGSAQTINLTWVNDDADGITLLELSVGATTLGSAVVNNPGSTGSTAQYTGSSEFLVRYQEQVITADITDAGTNTGLGIAIIDWGWRDVLHATVFPTGWTSLGGGLLEGDVNNGGTTSVDATDQHEDGLKLGSHAWQRIAVTAETWEPELQIYLPTGSDSVKVRSLYAPDGVAYSVVYEETFTGPWSPTNPDDMNVVIPSQALQPGAGMQVDVQGLSGDVFMTLSDFKAGPPPPPPNGDLFFSWEAGTPTKATYDAWLNNGNHATTTTNAARKYAASGPPLFGWSVGPNTGLGKFIGLSNYELPEMNPDGTLVFYRDAPEPVHNSHNMLCPYNIDPTYTNGGNYLMPHIDYVMEFEFKVESPLQDHKDVSWVILTQLHPGVHGPAWGSGGPRTGGWGVQPPFAFHQNVSASDDGEFFLIVRGDPRALAQDYQSQMFFSCGPTAEGWYKVRIEFRIDHTGEESYVRVYMNGATTPIGTLTNMPFGLNDSGRRDGELFPTFGCYGGNNSSGTNPVYTFRRYELWGDNAPTWITTTAAAVTEWESGTEPVIYVDVPDLDLSTVKGANKVTINHAVKTIFRDRLTRIRNDSITGSGGNNVMFDCQASDIVFQNGTFDSDTPTTRYVGVRFRADDGENFTGMGMISCTVKNHRMAGLGYGILPDTTVGSNSTGTIDGFVKHCYFEGNRHGCSSATGTTFVNWLIENNTAYNQLNSHIDVHPGFGPVQIIDNAWTHGPLADGTADGITCQTNDSATITGNEGDSNKTGRHFILVQYVSGGTTKIIATIGNNSVVNHGNSSSDHGIYIAGNNAAVTQMDVTIASGNTIQENLAGDMLKVQRVGKTDINVNTSPIPPATYTLTVPP